MKTSSDIRLELMRDSAGLFLEPSPTTSAAEVGSGLFWNFALSENCRASTLKSKLHDWLGEFLGSGEKEEVTSGNQEQ
jgi:hypothetical protein